MESAIQTIVNVFLKSSKGKENLGGNDFQKLVKSQFHNILTDTDSSKAVKEMQQGLDDNQDGKVSFNEYMKLVGYLANTMSQQRIAEASAESAAHPPENASAPMAPKVEEGKAHPEEIAADASVQAAAKSEKVEEAAAVKVEVVVKAEDPAPAVVAEIKDEGS